MTFKAISNMPLKLVLFCCYLTCIVGCNKDRNLSYEQPYSEALGKKFVLQQDCYIFKFNDDSSLAIGEVPYLPQHISSKYIGCNFLNLKIVGIARSGQIIQIEKIIEKSTFEDSYYYYYVLLNDPNDKSIYKVNAFLLCNTLKNPPYTQTWSDPPIFEAKFAEPLPSDGVWWK